MEKQNPIEEAERYVENAKSTLQTNGELDTETKLYGDKKYVRDAAFHVKSKTRPHPDIKDYKDAIAKRDKKLLQFVNAGYDTMHITMGYDGNQSKNVCDEGIRLANSIIKRCSVMI